MPGNFKEMARPGTKLCLNIQHLRRSNLASTPRPTLRASRIFIWRATSVFTIYETRNRNSIVKLWGKGDSHLEDARLLRQSPSGKNLHRFESIQEIKYFAKSASSILNHIHSLKLNTKKVKFICLIRRINKSPRIHRMGTIQVHCSFTAPRLTSYMATLLVPS